MTDDMQINIVTMDDCLSIQVIIIILIDIPHVKTLANSE